MIAVVREVAPGIERGIQVGELDLFGVAPGKSGLLGQGLQRIPCVAMNQQVGLWVVTETADLAQIVDHVESRIAESH